MLVSIDDAGCHVTRLQRTLVTLLLATPIAFLSLSCAWMPGGESPEPGPRTSRDVAKRPERSAEAEEALAALTRMSEFLTSRPAVQVSAEVHYDAVQPSGQKIEFGSVRRLTLQPPGRARFEVTHWDGARELIVFGFGRLSAAAPDYGVYASVEYDGEIATALDYIADEYAMVTPLSELFRSDLPEEVRQRMDSARHLGTVIIDGFACDHLVFGSDEVGFQLFVRQGDEPVPHRLVVDYLHARGAPQFRAQLRAWEWPAELSPSLFQLAPPPGAERVGFSELLDIVIGPVDGDGEPAP